MTDMRMPELDGATLLGIVAKKYPRVIRLVLSGQAHKKKLLQIVDTAHQFLTKPCETEYLIRVIESCVELVSTIDDQNVRRAVSKVCSVPSQPQVMDRLEQLWLKENTPNKEIFSLIGSDVGAVSKIMQLVSSSFLGAGNPVTMIEVAFEQLGGDLLKELGQDSNAFTSLQANDDRERECLVQINQESNALAGLAKNIAMAISEQESRKAYLAALLSNVGKLLILNSWPEKYSEIHFRYLDFQEQIEVENAEFGTCHPKIGIYLMQLWGMHDELIDIMSNCWSIPKVQKETTSACFAIQSARQIIASSSIDNLKYPLKDQNTFENNQSTNGSVNRSRLI